MATPASVLKRWATGVTKDAEAPDEGESPLMAGDDLDPDDMGDIEPNPFWEGTADSEPTPEEALELYEWLEHNEPDLLEAIASVADAVESLDEEELDAAAGALMEADQFLVPEYPDMDEDQRAELVAELQKNPKMIRADRTLAIANAVNAVRSTELVEGDEDGEVPGTPPAKANPLAPGKE